MTARYIQPGAPGTNYAQFRQQQITQEAAGAGLCYSLVARDASRGTYSSQRQDLLETWKEIDYIQQQMVNIGLRRVAEELTTAAVKEGRLDAPGYFTDSRAREMFTSFVWQPPPRSWIDPEAEANAVEKTLAMDLTTLRDEANKLNSDWRELIRQRCDEEAFEREERKSRGLPERQAPVVNPPTAGGDDGGEDDDGKGNDEPLPANDDEEETEE